MKEQEQREAAAEKEEEIVASSHCRGGTSGLKRVVGGVGGRRGGEKTGEGGSVRGVGVEEGKMVRRFVGAVRMYQGQMFVVVLRFFAGMSG